MTRKYKKNKCSKNCKLLISIAVIFLFFLIFLFLFNFLPRITAQDEFHIKSARSYVVGDGIVLDADMIMNFSEEVAEALENGIPLTIMVEVQLFRERFLWRNSIIKESRQLFELRYHPLTNIHEVKNMASGDRYSFNSRQDAMAVLGTIRGAHLIDKKMLAQDKQYSIQMRTSLHINSLPLTLRQIASLSSSWYLKSPWYLWNINIDNTLEKLP